MIIFLLIGLILGIALIIFAVQNITTITVAFLGWQIEGSLAFILILAAFAGALITMLVFLPDIVKKNVRLFRLRSKAQKLEEELQDTKIKVEEEKNKVVANNAYLDDVQNSSQTPQNPQI